MVFLRKKAMLYLFKGSDFAKRLGNYLPSPEIYGSQISEIQIFVFKLTVILTDFRNLLDSQNYHSFLKRK